MIQFGFSVVILSVVLVTQNVLCQKSQINSNERVGNLDWTPPDFDPAEFAEDRVSQGESCECVMFYLCDRNTGRIIDTGSGLVRWRTGGTDTPKKCKEVGEVCCKPPLWAEKMEGTSPEDPINPTDIETSSDNINNWNLPTDSEEVNTNYNPSGTSPNFPQDQDITGTGNHASPSSPLRCGERRPQKVDYRVTALRVSGADEETQTLFGEYPWMIMIHTIERGVADLKLFLCGGSLIHPQVIMTAAHCIAGRKLEDLETRAGEWDTTTESEPLKHQNRLVDSIIIHPSYNESHPRHDIALILLKEPFILADNVNTICLPEDDESYIGSRCIGTGWGMDNSGKRPEENQNLLRKADLPVVSKNDCQRMLRKTRLGRYFRLHDSFLCAGGDELDLCVGDGGGPLTCYNEKTENDVQIGITSWGIGCGTKNVPGVYTDVAAHRDWITSTVDYLLNGTGGGQAEPNNAPQDNDVGNADNSNWGNNDSDPDLGTDNGSDQGTDNGSDQGTDNGSDQGTDNGSDQGTDNGSDSDSGTDNGSETGNQEPGEINSENNAIPECACVESDLCEEQYRVTATGSDLYDWRSGGPECKENQVCCAKPKDIEPVVPELPAPEDTGDGGDIPLADQPGPEPLGCGQRRVFEQSQNYGEGFAEFAEFPWVLKLRDADDRPQSSETESFKCGASLIHPSLALTAAHCLLNVTPESIVVRAGEWDVTNQNEPLPYQERLVRKIILHPNFEHKNPKNDVAILVLDVPFDITDNVNSVCLPLPDDVLDTNKCVAAGWGQVDPEGEMQNVLKKITMPIVPKDECQNALRNTRLGRYFLLHDSFMCAGGEGVDTCVGDGGGPLMCPLTNTETYIQVGVVSWGINCAKAGRPGVYANVEKFLEWIDQEAKTQNIMLNQ